MESVPGSLEMHLQVIVVGRMKGGFSYLQNGIDDYLKRLKAYASVSIVEVADEAILPSRTDEQVMEREGQRIRAYMAKATYTIALSERGEQLTSEKFSTAFFDRLGANPTNGGIPGSDSRPIIFIVGGPLGLHPSVLNECDWTVSLSKMTFPHPMVRLILLEQLYRAFKIQRGEPYHK